MNVNCRSVRENLNFLLNVLNIYQFINHYSRVLIEIFKFN